MPWIEIKKNTVSVIFLLSVILVTIFTFFSVSPEVEYYYSKLLSSGEYTYFKLKEDIRQVINIMKRSSQCQKQ